MAICINCFEEFYRWKEDIGTPFQLCCCEECIQEHNEALMNNDWPRDPALKYKVPVGEIACPKCGCVQHGVLNPICPNCDRLYWTEEECSEENNPNTYESGESNETDRT